jgi:hypothetical protein
MGSLESHDERAHRAIREEAEEEKALLAAVAAPDQLPPEGIIRALGEVKLTDLDGSEVELGSMWRDKAAALVFLRHYG